MRARVTGYLEKVNLKEGAEIKQGDVLFEIDPRPAVLNLSGRPPT
jgi:multidrug resistance efflux pump